MGSVAFNVYAWSGAATVSGSWSGNTPKLYRELAELCISPTTSTTTYDVKIVDERGFTVFSRLNRLGEYVATMCLPCRGIYTLAITNASKDEGFTVAILHE
jgi:hypothetical protein